MKIKDKKTHNIRKILPLYAKHKNLLILVMSILLLSGVFAVLTPIFSANALSNLAMANFDVAINFAILMCACGLLKTLFNGLDEYFYIKINQKIQYDLTKTVIDSINKTKMKVLDNSQIGFLTERLSSDIGTISDNYLYLIDLFFSILTNAVFLIYIAYLNIYLFFILMAYVCILYVICTIKSRVWIRGRKLSKKAKDAARSAYYEQIAGVRDVKLLNIKDNITNYSNKKYEETLKIDRKVQNKRNLIRRVQSFVSIVFELVFLVIGIAFIKNEYLVLAGLLVVYAYYGRVEGLVQYISSFKEYKAESEIAASRVFELIDNYEKEEFGKEEIENFLGEIEFRNVYFGYTNDANVFENLNLKFEKNKMTAIVGKSGSGKTTILNLISKLYDISKGEILLDGKDIRTLSEQSIHKNIGEISQSPYIFNTTIRQNLLFVKPDAEEKELIEVLKKAQIYGDIKKFKKGIDTEIGENGVKLSGGQKQRIAIARLLLMDSKVIVFDEATSALDNESQSKIMDLLEQLKKDKTVIIVAHRLSTIVNSDIIYMLKDGHVLDCGTHKELIKNCQEYKQLYKTEEKNSIINEE